MTGRRVALSGQEKNPRSAVARTVFVAVLALFPILNAALAVIIAELQPYQVNLPAWLFPALNGILVATAVLMGIFTKVMALPGVNAWLRKYVPWLSPEDKHPAPAEPQPLPVDTVEWEPARRNDPDASNNATPNP